MSDKVKNIFCLERSVWLGNKKFIELLYKNNADIINRFFGYKIELNAIFDFFINNLGIYIFEF